MHSQKCYSTLHFVVLGNKRKRTCKTYTLWVSPEHIYSLYLWIQEVLVDTKRSGGTILNRWCISANYSGRIRSPVFGCATKLQLYLAVLVYATNTKAVNVKVNGLILYNASWTSWGALGNLFSRLPSPHPTLYHETFEL